MDQISLEYFITKRRRKKITFIYNIYHTNLFNNLQKNGGQYDRLLSCTFDFLVLFFNN